MFPVLVSLILFFWSYMQFFTIVEAHLVGMNPMIKPAVQILNPDSAAFDVSDPPPSFVTAANVLSTIDKE